jgi:hypothetical protein
MRRRVVAVALASAALFVGVRALEACGDKLLVLGLGARFTTNRAEHQARILHYIDPVRYAAVGDANLRSSIGAAGHKLSIARSPQEFEQALKNGQYDIVLIEVTDARRFDGLIRSAASKPIVLPTLDRGSKADLRATKRAYGGLAVKAPAPPQLLLDVIDTAMEKHRGKKP